MRTIFEQFGPVIEVHARRTYKLRGQAWVVFERGQDAEAAVKLIQGFPFYGKPLVRLAVHGLRPACAVGELWVWGICGDREAVGHTGGGEGPKRTRPPGIIPRVPTVCADGGAGQVAVRCLGQDPGHLFRGLCPPAKTGCGGGAE